MASIQTRIEKARTRASDAFWAEVVVAFPEITTGDLDPESAFAFETAQRTVIKRWLSANEPSGSNGS